MHICVAFLCTKILSPVIMKFPSLISLNRVDQEKLGKNRTRNQIIIIVSLKCTNKTVNQAEDVLFMIIEVC